MRIKSAILIVLILTTLNKSSLRAVNTQAAWLDEAHRAYESIVAYDENAPVTLTGIEELYRKDAALLPVKQAKKALRAAFHALFPGDAKAYAERCFYMGRMLPNPPGGIRVIKIRLLPFTAKEAEIYDGGKCDPDALYAQVVERAAQENVFLPYIDYGDGANSLIPVSSDCAFLSREALDAAFALKNPGDTTLPIRDARGVIVIELISTDPGRPSEAFFQGS